MAEQDPRMPSGEEKGKEPTIVFRVSPMECATQRRSARTGQGRENGGNDIAARKLNNVGMNEDDKCRQSMQSRILKDESRVIETGL